MLIPSETPKLKRGSSGAHASRAEWLSNPRIPANAADRRWRNSSQERSAIAAQWFCLASASDALDREDQLEQRPANARDHSSAGSMERTRRLDQFALSTFHTPSSRTNSKIRSSRI